MKTINVIEIDYEGNMSPVNEYQFEHLPRIQERIILPDPGGDPKVYQVKDIHHTLDEKTIVYVISDYRPLKSVIQQIASSLV